MWLAKHQSGFTLVELLISIIVGSVLVTAVNTIYTSQLYLSQQGRDTVLLNSFAESKTEALRSKGYLGIGNGVSDITSELPSELSAPRTATLTVSSQSTSVKRIELDITFNQQGRGQDYAYTTYIGELGVGQY